MAIQYSVTLRNERLERIRQTLGDNGRLKVYSGSAPASAQAAETGTKLAEITLPSVAFASAVNGTMAKANTWQDSSADASGTPGYFRLYQADASTSHVQGTVTSTTGGGDMTVDSVIWNIGQVFTVTSLTLTAGNA